MATITELEHLAAMANALRPDWPIPSLLTHLKANHGTRSYRDLAVALAWIATDPDTQTPARLLEQGRPWWTLTRPVNGSRGGPRHRLCPRCRDPHDPAVPCMSQPRAVIVRDSPDRLAAKAAARLALQREAEASVALDDETPPPDSTDSPAEAHAAGRCTCAQLGGRHGHWCDLWEGSES